MADRICSIDNCEAPTGVPGTGRGWCGKHYQRWQKHGDPLAAVSRRAPRGLTADERLRFAGWTVVVRRPELGPCWEWDGTVDPKGYGQLVYAGKLTRAHRLAHLTWNGPLNEDQQACHRCDNRLCIRPEHLFAGSRGENMADMVAKSRAANGERHGIAKLTDDDVAQIRADYTGRRGEQKLLAAVYEVSPSTIWSIVRGHHRIRPTDPVST